ncbi:DUF927 domain-containing protein [Enterobacter cloacae complex sp. 418I7]|uniref:DUF927 domain-containing protein n=1 Tax=Enterobacter cloacae complex sp. 418I7 TaxID=3395839 RepID=UPI003CF97E28
MDENNDDLLSLLLEDDYENDLNTQQVEVLPLPQNTSNTDTVEYGLSVHEEEYLDAQADYDDELKYKYSQSYERFASGEIETPDPILEHEFSDDEPHQGTIAESPVQETTQPQVVPVPAPVTSRPVVKAGFSPARFKTPAEDKQPVVAQEPVSKEEIYFTCSEGKITSEGIFFTTVKKGTQGEPDQVLYVKKHDYFLQPMEVYTAIDSNDEEFVKFRFSTLSDKIREVFLPNTDLNNFGKRGELLQSSFPPPPPNIISRLSSLVLSAIKALPKEKKAFTGYAKPGWTADGKYHIRPGHPMHIGIGAEYGTLMKAGSKELQYSAIKRAIDDALITAAIYSAAIAGYMRGKIWQTSVSHSLILHGEKGRGKSAQLMGVAAIQGKPTNEEKTNFFSGKSTEASLDREFAGNNHGVVALDESDDVLLADKKKGISRFMNFGNKGGNTRMENGKSTTYSFDLTLFASFNANYQDLISGSEKTEALNARMIGIDINHPLLKTFSDVKKVNEYRNTLLENYGHMYEDIIEYIKNNERKIKDKYDSVFNEIYDDKAMYILKEKEPRALEFLAICYAGAEALGDILGDDKYRIKAIEAIDVLVSEYRSANIDSEIDLEKEKKLKPMATYYQLKEFIITNPNRFYWKSMAFAEPNDDYFNRSHDLIKIQKAKAKEINNRLSGNNTVLGVIDITKIMKDESDLNGSIMLNEAGYREFEKSYGITKSSLLQAVRAINMIAEDKTKLNQKFAEKLNFDNLRGYKISLSEVEILSETPDVKVIPATPDNMFDLDLDALESSHANLKS